MTKTYDAVFENGTFRPLQPAPPGFPEGQRVRLVVEVEEESADVLRLAAQVYDGLSEEQAAGVEQIALDRRELFQPANS